MEEPSENWEIQENYTFEDNPRNMSWIVKRGLDLGKKILATCVVVSSVPIFLPPLLIISAFGLAVSIPSGLFLASYTCSEKLMSMLLPGPSPSSCLLEFTGTTYSDHVDEYRVRFDGENDIDENEGHIEDSEGGAERRFELPASDAGEGLEKVGSHLVIHDMSGNVQGGQVNDLVDDRIHPEVGATTMGMGEEIRDLPINGIQGIVLTVEAGDRAGLEDEGTSLEVTDVVIMDSTGRGRIQEEELARETAGLIEKLREEGKDYLREKLHEVADRGEDKELAKVVAESASSTSAGNVQSGAPLGKGRNTNLSLHERPEGGDEKIRKQIEAIQLIVGYKATPQSSCLEELEALYLFTGVELPESFKGISHMDELNEKLKFLMSIVGVK
ncbi:hypothetical protein SAY86_013119 [Trapa natans]|uniref:Uncharacterized protein n=1 Tax=Trapa natans TaxID=22666 RepID=A0AAN7RBC5_TRANT|nr:hypothetical protein SAY86_013119 [Trapa natans]